MFPLALDVDVTKAMVSYRQGQVRASFPRKIRRWPSTKPRPVAPTTSVTATPRLVEQGLAEPQLPQQQEEKYVA